MKIDEMSAIWRRSAYSARPAVMRGAPVSRTAPAAESSRVSAASAPAAAKNRSAALPFGPSEMPYVPEGYGPEELATRTRIRFPELGAPSGEDGEDAFTGPQSASAEESAKRTLLSDGEEKNESGKLPGMSDGEDDEKDKVVGANESKSAADEMQEAKCETCEKRKYQDGSNDPGVSFKNPTRVSPKMAQAAVRGHEMEHVVRERLKAQREGRKVVSQSVTYHTGICPECGKMYISGGTTRTVTAADNSSDYLDDLLGDDGFDITA